jgi:endogenous inhibitor of DNA gyrase (YacG/DUF329 family)
MGTYNQLAIVLKCPRCQRTAEMTVDLYFGFCDQAVYRIGDQYRWTSSPVVRHGGRPRDGNVDGEGYTECPSCGKDFFVKVLVRGDVLNQLSPI